MRLVTSAADGTELWPLEQTNFAPSIMKYALELQGYGAPNGHTDTSAARLVLSAQPTQLKLDEAHSRESEAIYGKSFVIKATLKLP